MYNYPSTRLQIYSYICPSLIYCVNTPIRKKFLKGRNFVWSPDMYQVHRSRHIREILPSLPLPPPRILWNLLSQSICIRLIMLVTTITREICELSNENQIYKEPVKPWKLLRQNLPTPYPFSIKCVFLNTSIQNEHSLISSALLHLWHCTTKGLTFFQIYCICAAFLYVKIKDPLSLLSIPTGKSTHGLLLNVSIDPPRTKQSWALFTSYNSSFHSYFANSSWLINWSCKFN